jgi:pSer/pThr/pTyr-binding forkhead associated (FHA) protein
VLAPQQAARAGFPTDGSTRRAARLVVVASPVLAPGVSFEIGPVPITVGRADDNALALPGDDFASSHHARIESTRDGVWVVDQSSTNGTLVDGRRIDGRRRLESGDTVRIGDTELRLEL